MLNLTFSINDDRKILENTKQGFTRKVSWKKNRSQITTQPKKKKKLD